MDGGSPTLSDQTIVTVNIIRTIERLAFVVPNYAETISETLSVNSLILAVAATTPVSVCHLGNDVHKID